VLDGSSGTREASETPGIRPSAERAAPNAAFG
jgi:hypothetical protein